MDKKQFIHYGIFGFAALIILIDFITPGTTYEQEIIQIKKTLQRYYNAGGNYHYTYKVVTSDNEFLIDEDHAALAPEGKPITYSLSPIFNQTNWYLTSTSGNKSYHSLRLASGLIMPLLYILALIVAFRFNYRLGKLLFIMQILLIADLIFLLY